MSRRGGRNVNRVVVSLSIIDLSSSVGRAVVTPAVLVEKICVDPVSTYLKKNARNALP